MTNRGQGRVYRQNGSPYWYVAFYAHGKELREAAKHVCTGAKLEATEKNHHEAERWLKHRLRELTAEKHGGHAFIGPQQERVTVGELLDGLERDYKLRDKWGGKIASLVKPLRERFGTWRAVALDSDAIGKYMEALREEGYSNATVNRRTQIIGQAFNIAIEDKKLAAHVAPKIRRLSEAGNERQDIFTEADLAAVIENLPNDLQDLCRWCAACGMRRGEAIKLQWRMIDERTEPPTLKIPGSICKNGEGRELPLIDSLLEIVNRRRDARAVKTDTGVTLSPYVFHRDDEVGPIGEFRKAWKSANEKANCQHLFHSTRRFAATAMLEAGLSPEMAMDWTGHSTHSMLRRYQLIKPEKKAEGFKALELYRAKEQAKAKQTVVAMGR